MTRPSDPNAAGATATPSAAAREGERPGHTGQNEAEGDSGIVAEWDTRIESSDGIVLRADVFRPKTVGRYPVILTMGPYGKGLAFQDGFGEAWSTLVQMHPDVMNGSTCRYQNWETVDPEKWVPDGYVCVRVDSRGAGRSPGHLDHWSPRETQDLYECIEWAAMQPWSNGRIGLLGISYYATNQWHVASLQPPHLAAMCVWEGAADYYRDIARHGGILCDFIASWFQRLVLRVQHGVGASGPKSRVTGELVAGPETLENDALERVRTDPGDELANRPLADEYYRARSPQYDQIRVPLLSCGNWGGQGLHLRGNVEGFLAAHSTRKWLELHAGTHYSEFYSARGTDLQKRFFGYFLRDEDTGWKTQPAVQLQIRHADGQLDTRYASEWPLPETGWTKLYLRSDGRLSDTWTPGGTTEYHASGDGVTFRSEPLARQMEITGPLAARIFVSSATSDADLFLVLRVFRPDGDEVTFQGSNDPRTPIAMGWLRASHRKLDEANSTPYRPYHPHDEMWPLKPNEVVALDVEIWPTCIVIPAGFEIGLTVRGRDYDNGIRMRTGTGSPMYGVGPFVHVSDRDRPQYLFDAVNRLHFAPQNPSYVLLPVIPSGGSE